MDPMVRDINGWPDCKLRLHLSSRTMIEGWVEFMPEHGPSAALNDSVLVWQEGGLNGDSPIAVRTTAIIAVAPIG